MVGEWTTGEWSTPVRLWRVGPWSRNLLMRPCDRLESVVVLVVVLVVLILVPFAAACGTATYTRLDAQARAERAAEHQVAAVLVEDSRPVSGEHRPVWSAEDRGHARAQWTLAGRSHSGDVQSAAGARAGHAVSVWINSTGDLAPAPAPATGTENAATAVSAAVVLWSAGASGAAVLLRGVRWATSRHRMSRWAAEWNELGKPTGWHVS